MAEIKIPWPDWEVGEMIGRGGFGTVYAIENRSTGEESSLKLIVLPQEDSEILSLRADGYDDQSIALQYRERLGRIMEEYKFMARLKDHPNIVRCEDCESLPHADGMGWDIFIRMERLTSVTQYLTDHTLSMKDIVTLGIHICRALEVCQQNDIVHRDIKPENIFISQYGYFKLGDFGIARTMDHTTAATHTGSYRYMAPEVFKNQKYDRTVDIYSLGLVLYWLLNSRRMPFLPTDRPPKASEYDAALEKRMSGKPMNEPINGSGKLKDIVMKACAYSRKNRFQSAEEMRQALELTPEALGGHVNSGTGPAASGPSKKAGPGEREGGSTVGSSWIDTDGTIGTRTGGSTSGEKDSGRTTCGPETGRGGKKDGEGLQKKKDKSADILLLRNMLLYQRQAWEKKAGAAQLGFFQKAKKRSLEEEAMRLKGQAEEERLKILSRHKEPSDLICLMARDPDAVPFGHLSSGRPILWQVLDITGSQALMVSKYALWSGVFNWEMEDVTWENSVIRSDLADFAEGESFSPEEKQRICMSKVTADKYRLNHTDQGHDTHDRIFLLSALEASRYFSGSSLLQCQSLDLLEEGYQGFEANVRWWLRTMGDSPLEALYIHPDGSFDVTGTYVNTANDSYAYDAGFDLYVRPAMRIDLS